MSATEVIVVGLNHQAAPVEVRELLAFSPVKLREAQMALRQRAAENVILSTCNRMEVYAVSPAGRNAGDDIVAFLGEFHGLGRDEYAPYLYRHVGMEAVGHLFTVAAGLDSMILGEPQILGQVRAAYEASAASHTAGPLLSRAFSQALKAGKKVRSDTAISRHAVSVSYAAVELARKIFGSLAGRKVLVVGAGKMGELAARTLLDNGLAAVVVTNRTYAIAMELAGRFGGRAAEFERLPDLVAEADVAIASTGAPGFVLTSGLVRQAMRGRRNRPLFLIDIAVPRDIDPQVQTQDNVFLYDIDDLQSVCAANLEERRREVALARRIIEIEVAEFAAWREGRQVAPTISALRQRLEEIRQAEIRKSLGRCSDLSDQQRSAVEALTCAMVNKILHQPVTRLKAKSGNPDGARYDQVVRELFALDEEI
ncbi:MAG: glutamyl-tRNA reductase [Chloroflexota bacterium]